MYYSVVIPTRDRKELLRDCLAAVMAQDCDEYEVVVVDDGSTDGTQDMVARTFPRVHLVRQDPSRGPAAARNRGIRLAKGKVVVFTDDDCVPPSDWISKLGEGFKQFPEAGVVGGYQEPPDELCRHSALARYEKFVTRCLYGVGRDTIVGKSVPIGTNNVAIRKDLIELAGGFDESFPVAAGEDADLLERIATSGYLIVRLPVGVIHQRTYTWSAFVRQQVRRGIGAQHFMQKRGRAHPVAREMVRLAATPLLVLLGWYRYHDLEMALLHGLSGFLQTWGRIRARGFQGHA